MNTDRPEVAAAKHACEVSLAGGDTTARVDGRLTDGSYHPSEWCLQATERWLPFGAWGQPARMADQSGEITAIAARLHSLECRCGRPAFTIHLVDGDVARLGPWRRGEPGCNTLPATAGLRAMPACDEHTYFGVGLRVDWLSDHWKPWVTHMDLDGLHAPRAVLTLLTEQEDLRQDAEAWNRPGGRRR